MFSQAVADEIIAGLAQGKSLRAVCREDGMPAATTVLGWLDDEDKKDFAEQYTRTRTRSYAMLGDDILDIPESEPDVARAKLMVDARKWMLSKMLPKVYGDKIDVAHTGGVTLTVSNADEAL